MWQAGLVVAGVTEQLWAGKGQMARGRHGAQFLKQREALPRDSQEWP